MSDVKIFTRPIRIDGEYLGESIILYAKGGNIEIGKMFWTSDIAGKKEIIKEINDLLEKII